MPSEMRNRGKEDKSAKAGPKGKEKEDGATSEEQRRLIKVIEEFGAKAPEKVQPYIRKAAPVLATMWIYFLVALPYIAKGIQTAQEIVSQLPERVCWMIVGFTVCFFGGVFPATIAAFEAARLCGVRQAFFFCKELFDEWKKVQEAKTEDGQNVLDMSKVGTPDFIVQRSKLVLKTVDPNKVNTSVVGLYTAWIGVLAALKIRFAKTVTLGAVIGEKLYEPAQKVEPILESFVSEEYKKWIPMGVQWVCKVMAITVAWWIERIFAALHSAVRGGTLFGRHLVHYLKEKEIIKATPEETFIDEYAGWALAALGLLFQLYNGFHVPFPLNLVLWPVQLVEAFIVWSVNMA